MIHPVLSQVFPLEQTGEAAYQVHHNMHEGKIGVLCLAPEKGLGIDDPSASAPNGGRPSRSLG
jgi:crotonyl-CoA reductase